MLIGMRNAMMAGKRLPYDAEVEYLGARTGRAGVAFYHACSPNTVFHFDCETLLNAANNSLTLGYLWFSEDKNFLLGCATNAQGLYLDFGSGYGYGRIRMYEPSLWVGRRMNLTCGNNYMRDSLSGVEVSGATQSFDSSRYDGEPFNVAINTTGRIYGFSLFDNGIKIVDFQPVRFTNDSDVSEGALYDEVSGELFRNIRTTGAFTIGPDASAANGGV